FQSYASVGLQANGRAGSPEGLRCRNRTRRREGCATVILNRIRRSRLPERSHSHYDCRSTGAAVMRHSKRFVKPLVCFVVGLASISAQSPRTFKTRLSPVPIDVSMQATIAGSGSVTAVP